MASRDGQGLAEEQKGRARQDPDVPSLQDRHRELTRQVILGSLAELIAERGVHNFSVQEVADRAGISHRTVYRHFKTRDELISELGEWLEEIQHEYGLPGLPVDARELPEQSARTYAFFDEHPGLVRALAIVSSTTEYRVGAKEERTRAFRRVISGFAPGLEERRVRTVAGAMRCLASSQSWLYLKEQVGLSGEEAAEAVEWALGALLRDLEEATGR